MKRIGILLTAAVVISNAALADTPARSVICERLSQPVIQYAVSDKEVKFTLDAGILRDGGVRLDRFAEQLGLVDRNELAKVDVIFSNDLCSEDDGKALILCSIKARSAAALMITTKSGAKIQNVLLGGHFGSRAFFGIWRQNDEGHILI